MGVGPMMQYLHRCIRQDKSMVLYMSRRYKTTGLVHWGPYKYLNVCRHWETLFRCHHLSTSRLYHTPSKSGHEADSENVTSYRTKPPWKILYFGTDDFSLHTLKVLYFNRSQTQGKVVRSIEVVTKTKSPVMKFAEVNGLVTHDWPISISHAQFDVGVLVSFGKLIPHNIIKQFPYGILNIHPSLLPRWRGAAPIPHTVLHGDPQTGVSIIQIRPARFDEGPILLQTKLPVPHRCTSLQLASVLAERGGNMILEVLSDLLTYIEDGVQQNKEGATLAHKLNRKMSYINWERQTCWQIDQQFRALHELLPLRTEWQGKSVKLFNMVISEDDIEQAARKYFNTSHFSSGQPFYRKRSDILYIRCKDGWVGFKNLVLRTPMTAKDFDSGYLSKTFNKGVNFKSVCNGLFDTSIS